MSKKGFGKKYRYERELESALKNMSELVESSYDPTPVLICISMNFKKYFDFSAKEIYLDGRFQHLKKILHSFFNLKLCTLQIK